MNEKEQYDLCMGVKYRMTKIHREYGIHSVFELNIGDPIREVIKQDLLISDESYSDKIGHVERFGIIQKRLRELNKFKGFLVYPDFSGFDFFDLWEVIDGTTLKLDMINIRRLLNLLPIDYVLVPDQKKARQLRDALNKALKHYQME